MATLPEKEHAKCLSQRSFGATTPTPLCVHTHTYADTLAHTHTHTHTHAHTHIYAFALALVDYISPTHKHLPLVLWSTVQYEEF
jgi:hypothetical protein